MSETSSVTVYRRVATALIVVAALVISTLVAGAGSASASTQSTSSFASRLMQLINSARTSHGLRPLSVASGTTSVAATWTAHMARTRDLVHNGNLLYDLQHHGSADMSIGAENIGCGAQNDPDGLFRAYMNSPEHRANILNSRMRYMGVAVAFGGQYAWNTMDFVDVYGVHHASTANRTPTRTHVQPRTTHRTLSSHPTTHAVARHTARPARAKTHARPVHRAAKPKAVVIPHSMPTRRAVAEFVGLNTALSDVTPTRQSGGLAVVPLLIGGFLLAGLFQAHRVVRRRFSF